jgi:2-polyprenyl-6-methoxyphenol hydroxylase-like FAD-dependent oxidoreductase
MGKGLSRFPFALIVPQDAHEKFLVEHLRAEGVEVEWRTELVGLQQDADKVVARLRREGDTGAGETSECAYLAGCDGAHSAVRQALDVRFPGGTYNHLFYVADVEATGPVMNRELNVALDTADFLAIFPLVGPRHARLVGIVRDDAAEHEQLAWDDVSKEVIERLGLNVQKVNWFSTYRVHHRVARRFRVGRAFLLGDAAHIHSPVGGQGMNTGIGDAVNLSWKLAWALAGRSAEKALDSYECERQRFAKRLVETTDRAFTVVTRNGPVAEFVRVQLAPRLLPLLARTHFGPRFVFRSVSQIGIHYRGCELSAGRAGDICGGDRLPWVRLGPGDAFSDNYEPLGALRWQVHVYGEGSAEVERYCAERRFALHVFPWRPAMESAGFARNAIYLVRPDGYVASAQLALPDSP